MKWASELSDQPGLDDAIAACVSSIQRQLDGDTADLAVVFVSAHHQERYGDIPGIVPGAVGGQEHSGLLPAEALSATGRRWNSSRPFP